MIETQTGTISYDELRDIVVGYLKANNNLNLVALGSDYFQSRLETGSPAGGPLFTAKNELGDSHFDLTKEQIESIVRSYLAEKGYELEKLIFSKNVTVAFRSNPKVKDDPKAVIEPIFKSKMYYEYLRGIIAEHFKEKEGVALSYPSIDYFSNKLRTGEASGGPYFSKKTDSGVVRFDLSKEEVEEVLREYLAKKGYELTSVDYNVMINFEYKKANKLEQEKEETKEEIKEDVKQEPDDSKDYGIVGKIVEEKDIKESFKDETNSYTEKDFFDRLVDACFEDVKDDEPYKEKPNTYDAGDVPHYLVEDGFDTKDKEPIGNQYGTKKPSSNDDNVIGFTSLVSDSPRDDELPTSSKQALSDNVKVPDVEVEEIETSNKQALFDNEKVPDVEVEEIETSNKQALSDNVKVPDRKPVTDQKPTSADLPVPTLDQMAREHRRFTILQRERAMNEEQRKRNRCAIIAAGCILGAAVALMNKNQDLSEVIKHELDSIYSWDSLVQYFKDLGPLVTGLAASAGAFVASAFKHSKQFKKLQGEFEDFNSSLERPNLELGGNENDKSR